MEGRAERIGRVVAGVLEQALVDAHAERLVLLADGSPEAKLLEQLVGSRLGSRLHRVPASGGAPADLLEAWARATREHPDALVAAATNKTAAVLGGAPPVPLLPLADLWASQVEMLCGAWTAPDAVRSLAQRAGGAAVVDRALAALVDQRRAPDDAAAYLPAELRGTLLALWERARFARRRIGLVPKLGARTLGVDLFD